MKRITFIMAAIVCLAISAMAQQNADQPLSPSLWKQGVARCAHYTAYAKGFAKKTDEMQRRFPQGYTLDDLNEVYGNQGAKWQKIYKEFKDKEEKNGSLNDLKALVIPQVWKLVEPDFQAFITDHPEIANEVPEATGDNPDAVQKDGEGVMPPPPGKGHRPGPHDRAHNGPSCPVNLPLWLGILGSLLGLIALLTSLCNRGKIKEMQRTFARELDRTNANLQEFSTDAADQIKALSIRLTGKTLRKPIVEETADAVVAPIAEPVEDIAEEPIPEAEPEIEEETVVPVQEEVQEEVLEEKEVEEGEIVNLFMSKPDENDDFTRVSEEFEQGNSIYVLTTFDGKHGKFEVIDKPEVHRFALMMPAENLLRACSGNAIQIPNGSRIVTDRAGEAELIDGKWHVVVKAIIHYEG